jgi:hypothetical protein
MGELIVEHAFKNTPDVKIQIQPKEGDKIVLKKGYLKHTFSSGLANQIVVKVQGHPKHCTVKPLPYESDLILKSIEGVNINAIRINSERLYISNPPPNWEFIITIPETIGEPPPVTIGDNPP